MIETEIKESKKEKVSSYVLKNLHFLEFESGGGGSSGLKYPEFKLYPRDYLNFAEHELEAYLKKENAYIHLINCVSHLKRSIDSQLDVNLYALNLYNIFQKNNLKFTKKLEFFRDIGIFNSRTLERFNTVRNKMEHYYEIPQFEDIEVYFDLVTAFIALLESMLAQLVNMSEIRLDGLDYEDNTVGIQIHYIYKEPKIRVKLDTVEGIESIEVTPFTKEDRSIFPYFLKLLLLFYKKENFLTNEHFLKELNNHKF